MILNPRVCSLCAAALVAAAALLAAGPLRADDPKPPAEAAGGGDAPLQAVLEAERQRIAGIQKAVPAAVSVFGRGGRGGGSGVVVTPDGYALTNFHVVRPAGNFMKCSMPDGRLYDAVLVSIDPTGDVALIKMLGRDDFPAAELGDSDAVNVGDWCFAVGNPFLLATDFQPTVTYGIVSGVHRYQYPAGTLLEYADCIQTDASINPGNSGGPLFNARGQLIGINGRGSFEKRGRVNVGVGYAISINQIKHFMGYLRSGRIVDHATLGATVSSDDEGRVIVSNIIESADAYRRGLRYGDEIVSFAGRPITTVNGFKNALGIFPRGWRIPLSFRRDGERLDVFVRLRGVHNSEELIAKVQGQAPEDPHQPKDKPQEPDDGDPGDGEPDDKKPDDKNKKPDDKKPDDKKPDDKKPALRRPRGPAAAPPPPEVAKYLEARRGYANYYFNLLNRGRIWDALVAASGDYKATAPTWTLKGDMQGVVEVDLGEDVAVGRFPRSPARVESTKDLSDQMGPDGSGGLLAALHCWQRFLRLGPEKFGQVYYLGSMPLITDPERHYDVLVGIYNVVECRFFFDPKTGQLAAMEMFSDPDRDPCELFFQDYQTAGLLQFPRRIEVRYGDGVYGVVQWDEPKLAAAP